MLNNTQILERLLELGLSESETKIYVSMLSLGDTTIERISKVSGVKRTTIYPLISNLRNLGLVSIKEKGFKKFYYAENPKRLRTMIERKKEDLLSVLPSLETLYNLEGNDILIKTYEGVEAMKSVYDELLQELGHNDEYLVIGDPDRWDRHAKDYFKEFIKKRLKIDLRARLLLSYSDTSKEYMRFQENFKEEVRILPESYIIDANVVITNKKLIIHQLYNPAITIVIEAKSVISLQKNLFEILWNFCA